MKRYLAGAAVAGCLFAFGAGTAGAKASYDLASQSGFISRGDVIAAGGKDALVPDPTVTFTRTFRMGLTCTWPDSTRRSTTLSSTVFIQSVAETRYAGNGNITGYLLSRNDVVFSDITPFPDATATCWSLLGLVSNGTPVQTDMTPLGTTSELSFVGPSGPFDLGF